MSRGAETTSTRSVAETEATGSALADRLAPGDLVSLEGDLGAGKTVFVRGLARGLGHEEGAVSSPSFVLSIEHRGGRLPLLHVDLYRLPEGAGLEELGIEDAMAAGWVVAVEWGERLPGFLRESAWRVMLGSGESEGERGITLLPPSAPGSASD